MKYNIDQLIDLITELKLFDPKMHGKYMYSTANYFIIGKICDVLTKSSRNYLKLLFNRLELKHTYFIDDLKTFKMATGYDTNGKKINIPEYLKQDYYGVDICATYDDLNEFMKKRNQLISNKNNIKLLTKNFDVLIENISNKQRISHGAIGQQYSSIGCRLININDKTFILAAGHFPGYHVSSIYSLDYKTVINTFSNVDRVQHIYHMDELSKLILISLETKSKFYIKPIKIKKIPDINKYLGIYKNEYTFYKVYVNDEGKLMLFSRKQENELYYIGNDTFFRNNFSQIIIKKNKMYVKYFYGQIFELDKS